MSAAEHIRGVYERYPTLFNAGDVDGIVALYAEDATIEDPIGSEPHRGRGAIRAFYAGSAGSATIRRTGPVCVAGREAATPMVVLLGPAGSPDRKALDVVSVMAFDEAGKITSMRAFWSFDAMRPATPADEP